MGSTNAPNRFTLPDNLSQDFWLIPYALSSGAYGVGVGDLCYDAGSGVAYPADQLATLSTEALDQAQFAQKFVGVSQEQVLSTETTSTKKFTLRVQGVMDFKCPSQTFNPGDLVGIYSNGTTLDPQQVDKVTHPALAIGVVVRYYGTATTTVRCYVQSRKTNDFMSDWASAPTLFGGQAVGTTNALSDAAATLTVGSAIMQSMVPTAARNVTLPKEAQSKGLTYLIFNNSGGANSLTIKGSAGSNASGNPTIPQTKVGFCYCDGTTWTVLVSA